MGQPSRNQIRQAELGALTLPAPFRRYVQLLLCSEPAGGPLPQVELQSRKAADSYVSAVAQECIERASLEHVRESHLPFAQLLDQMEGRRLILHLELEIDHSGPLGFRPERGVSCAAHRATQGSRCVPQCRWMDAPAERLTPIHASCVQIFFHRDRPYISTKVLAQRAVRREIHLQHIRALAIAQPVEDIGRRVCTHIRMADTDALGRYLIEKLRDHAQRDRCPSKLRSHAPVKRVALLCLRFNRIQEHASAHAVRVSDGRMAIRKIPVTRKPKKFREIQIEFERVSTRRFVHQSRSLGQVVRSDRLDYDSHR